MNSFQAALVAGLTGAAVMALELTAVRLMAPHFGDSAYVWTNVIGVILVALALGAFLGGRMADKDAGGERLFWLLLVAGVLTALVPVVAPVLGSWLVPADLLLDSAMGALVRGSLAATTLLFAVPVLLVACVSPVLVTMLVARDGRVGHAAGLVSAMATIGSLLGTFAATHVLIPQFGSRWTVWICAALLTVAALLCRYRSAGAAALLVPVVAAFFAPDVLKPLAPGETLVAEVESDYQYLQVLDVEEPVKQRILRINEGLDSFHSVAIEGTAFTGGVYYDYHVAAPFLARDGAETAGVRVLSLGEAAGTFARLFRHVHPECRFDGVEIDPAVMRLGDEYFAGERPRGRQIPVDARVFVDNTKSRYDVVLVDTYKNQIYIPSHIASEQFFRAVHGVLDDGGIVSVNSGGLRFDDPVVKALANTMAAVFGEAWGFRVPRSRNFVLMARRGKLFGLTGITAARSARSDPELAAVLAKMAPRAAWHRFEKSDAGLVLQDDRPLLDVLQEKAYQGPGAAPELMRIEGDRLSKTIEAEVAGLYAEGRIETALDRVEDAEAATPRLRRLAGNCRWMLRDTAGAVLEYEDAMRLGLQDERLAQDLRFAEEEVAARARALAVGSRNGWLALVSIAVLFGLSWWGGRRILAA